MQDVPVLEPLAPFSLSSNIPTLPHTRLQVESGESLCLPKSYTQEQTLGKLGSQRRTRDSKVKRGTCASNKGA